MRFLVLLRCTQVLCHDSRGSPSQKNRECLKVFQITKFDQKQQRVTQNIKTWATVWTSIIKFESSSTVVKLIRKYDKDKNVKQEFQEFGK